MPELPEVETIRRDLEKALTGDTAAAVEVFDRRLMSWRDEMRWQKRVMGQSWDHFRRKGKYLWIELANQWRVAFHLRMTGQLLITDQKTLPSPRAAPVPLPSRRGEGGGEGCRMQIVFASQKVLSFCDQRRFGEVWLLGPTDAWHSKNPLGPDALTELRCDDFVRLVKGRATRIQPLLMNQQLLSGVGNIYAQESLFKAAIRPTRPGRRMSSVEASRLFSALQETLQTAIDHRGSSSRNYRDAHGEEGSAQTLHAVYRKGGQPCPRCQGILRATRVGGRGTVFCPQCQK